MCREISNPATLISDAVILFQEVDEPDFRDSTKIDPLTLHTRALILADTTTTLSKFQKYYNKTDTAIKDPTAPSLFIPIHVGPLSLFSSNLPWQGSTVKNHPSCIAPVLPSVSDINMQRSSNDMTERAQKLRLNLGLVGIRVIYCTFNSWKASTLLPLPAPLPQRDSMSNYTPSHLQR